MYPLNKEPVVYKKCPNGVVALCATCHFHARAGGHKLGEHTFADPSEAEDKPEGSPTEEPQLVSKGPATNESNFGDRNSFGESIPLRGQGRAAEKSSGSAQPAQPAQDLKHDMTGRAYGHAATQHKIQMRVGLRFIVHLSKPFLTRTLGQTANPTTDGFQYVGVGVGEQKLGDNFCTQVYVDTLDVVVVIPEACFSGDTK